jgi:sugar phosphate isomerase/epimerase
VGALIYPGLVSITFRQKSPLEIVKLVEQAQLQGIEWGGDVHVPYGDVTTARAVAEMTADAGLSVAAYGSYYRAGAESNVAFEAVVETAAALGAPTIRVWAGNRASVDADQSYRQRVVLGTRYIADMAAAAGMTISFEHHGGTLTDTHQSAREFLEKVNHSAVRSYWQPPVGHDVHDCLLGLTSLSGWLSNVHVFAWGADHTRYPLADGGATWLRYLRHAAALTGDRFAMIEFVKDDADEHFLADAVTLKEWLRQCVTS